MALFGRLALAVGFEVFRNAGEVIGEHTITLSADGLTDNTQSRSRVMDWGEVHSVVSFSKDLFIYLEKPNLLLQPAGKLGIQIPKDAFPSSAAAQEFEQQVRASILEAKALLPQLSQQTGV